MRHRHPLLLLPVVALFTVACASGNPGVPSVGERERDLSIQVQRGGENLNLRTISYVDVVHDTLSGETDDLFSLLPTVYNDLDIPISTLNAEAHTLGALEVRARGDFAGERISRWIDCGNSITGDIADQREIYFTVLTQIEPLEEVEGSGISTHVKAYAIQAGRAGNRTGCRTRARLERRIARELRELAGEGQQG